MRFEKVLEVTINVLDPIDYCADRDQHVRRTLRTQYEGKCYMGCCIVRVKSIQRISACRIVSTNGTGGGYFDVRFVAEVAIFAAGEILVGVEIVSRQPMLAGSYDRGGARASVIFRASRAAELISAGQRVPARVRTAQHAPTLEATVEAELLTADHTAAVYRLQGALEPAAASIELAPMVEAIAAELAARAALVAERRHDLWFFELLLHPYRTRTEEGGREEAVRTLADGVWEGPPPPRPVEDGAQARNVVDLVRSAMAGTAVPVDGFWSRSLSLYRSSPLAAHAPTAAPFGGAKALRGSPAAFFAECLRDILGMLVAIREMAETYNTRELIEKHTNLWKIMRSAQKDA